jgi:hypothetical protein
VHVATRSGENVVEHKQRVINILIAKYREELRLVPTDILPTPAYDFDPTGWLLFRVDVEASRVGAAEYVAIHPITGKIRFFGKVGE